jgi:uncharacterized protein
MGLRASVKFFLFWVAISAALVGTLARAESINDVARQAKGGYITDLAGVLSPGAKEQLTALCTEVQQKTQAQIAVVIIKSLDGEDKAQYGTDLGQKLGVGPKGQDRGVLILLAVNDRQYFTATGYGLEPILPDGKIGGFGREMVPYLRRKDYDGAVLLLTRRIADVIAADRGVTLTGPSPAPELQPAQNLPHIPLFLIFLVIFLIYLAIRSASRPGRGGGYTGSSGWWIGPVIGSTMGRGGWGGGGFGGGGGGGGGFGGFGGGSFGGGGAGGSW